MITIEQALEANVSIDRTIGGWRQNEGLLEAALKLSFDLDHSVYDCIYLTLARHLNALCITADKKLLSVAPKGWAVALANWEP